MRKNQWVPRFWLGCNFPGIFNLFKRNHFSVDLRYLYIAVIDFVISILNTVLGLIKDLRYGRSIKKLHLEMAPLIIIGHWRTGTTWLHELLVLDKDHAFPNHYQCFAPNHFLLTERVFPKLLRFLVPPNRIFDKMPVGWDRPQEDEFALCNLGLPSPYLKIAFPNNESHYENYMDLEGLKPKEIIKWKQSLLKFLKEVSFRNPKKRLIIKSPPHSCRIKVLLEMFPEAKFVHIIRNPYEVFGSTIKLWKTLYAKHGFQVPKFKGLEDYVFKTFIHFYEKIEEGKKLIKSKNFHEIKYEDLVKNPVEELGQLYRKLNLGSLDPEAEKLQEYLKQTAGYRADQYEYTPEVRDKIKAHWGEIIEKYYQQ